MGQSSPKLFRGCYPLRPPIVPNFIEISQTSLEIGVVRKKNFHTHTYMWHTHGILTTWVALCSARGATKNEEERQQQDIGYSPPCRLNIIFVMYADNNRRQSRQCAQNMWQKIRHWFDNDVGRDVSHSHVQVWFQCDKKRLRSNVQDCFQERYDHQRAQNSENWGSVWLSKQGLLTVASARQ